MKVTAVPTSEDDASNSDANQRSHRSAQRSSRRLVDAERGTFAMYQGDLDDQSYESGTGPDPIDSAIAEARLKQARRRKWCLTLMLLSGIVMIILGISLGIYVPAKRNATQDVSSVQQEPYPSNLDQSYYSDMPPPEDPKNQGKYEVPPPTMDLALICNKDLLSNQDNAVEACHSECAPGLCCWTKDPAQSCYDWGLKNKDTCREYYEPCILLDDYQTNTQNDEKDEPRPVETIDPSTLISAPPVVDSNIWQDGRYDAKWTLLLYEDFEFAEKEGGKDAVLFAPGGDDGDADWYTGTEYSNSGESSMMIRDGNGSASSIELQEDLNLSFYGQVRIRFWMKGEGHGSGMEGTDSFYLEYSPDSGNSWDIVKLFQSGSSDYPMNDSPIEQVVTMSRLAEEPFDFTDQARFRFRANANGDNDQLYIDDVEISGGASDENIPSIEVKNDIWNDKSKWTVLTYDNFEYDFSSEKSNFESGGNDAQIFEDEEQMQLYVNSGMRSAKICDNNDVQSSFSHKQDLDLSQFEQVRVRFWFIGDEVVGMEKEDNFSLQYSPDSGETYLIIKQFDFGNQDFPVNSTPQEYVVIMDRKHRDLSFTPNARFRFKSDASGQTDCVYIDDVEVSGTGSFTFTASVQPPEDNWIEEERPEVVPEMEFWDEDLDGGQWTVITFDDFEFGFDNSSYVPGGDDSVIISEDGPPFSNSGYGSVRISDKFDEETNPFFEHFVDHYVSQYAQMRVLFWFMGDEEKGFEIDEYFKLEYSSNSGTNWTEIKRWTSGSDEFKNNGVGYLGFAYINEETDNPNLIFTPNARLRFTSVAGGSSDRVYIDDILWSGTTSPVNGLTTTPDWLMPGVPQPFWELDQDGWTELVYDDFENGVEASKFTGFENDHVRWYNEGRPNSNSGVSSVRIEDNDEAESSFYLKDDLDLTPYNLVRLRFWFRGRGDGDLGYDEGDSFAVDYSNDSGSTWDELKSWIYGSADFEKNGIDYVGQHWLQKDDEEHPYTSNVRFRFRSFSKDDQAKVFIDDVEISAK